MSKKPLPLWRRLPVVKVIEEVIEGVKNRGTSPETRFYKFLNGLTKELRDSEKTYFIGWIKFVDNESLYFDIRRLIGLKEKDLIAKVRVYDYVDKERDAVIKEWYKPAIQIFDNQVYNTIESFVTNYSDEFNDNKFNITYTTREQNELPTGFSLRFRKANRP